MLLRHWLSGLRNSLARAARFPWTSGANSRKLRRRRRYLPSSVELLEDRTLLSALTCQATDDTPLMVRMTTEEVLEIVDANDPSRVLAFEVLGTVIAESDPGSVVKLEFDPSVTNPSEIGYIDDADTITVGEHALATEDTVT